MSEQDQESRGAWRFIRLDQFDPPPEPAREKMRRGVLGVWDRLKGGLSAAESPTIEMDLEAMPGELLAEVAPPPNWADGVSALHEALEDWWKEQSGKIQAVVGAPYSGTAEIVREWASVFQCPVLPDPSLEHIKSDGTHWLEEIDKYPDRVWVIPRLERCYLRHSQGFGLLRALFDKITTSSTRFLLACDSWAWAYLSKALHIDTLFPTPVVLEAFDHEKLDLWLGDLAAQTTKKPFIFRQANNHSLVLHPDRATLEEEGGKPEEISDFLQRLAAYSRGIPGVAHIIWRYSLRFAENKEEPQISDDGRHRIIWVEPWSAMQLPRIPALDRREGDLFVLHTLLLHDGLTSELLAHSLPFPESQIKGILQVLQVAGIIVKDGDTWRVAASAYPAIRDFLEYEGYLLDAL